MEPQPIDKTRLLDLRYSLKSEFIKCNSGGACAASSIIMCNTKKWHSLLSVFRENTGQQYILLSALDDSVIANSRTYYLSTRKYPNVYFPLGHQYLEDVSINPVPTLIYNVGDAMVQKEVLLHSSHNMVMIRYTLLQADNSVTLQLRPMLGLRHAGELKRKSSKINTGNKAIENGIVYISTDKLTQVFMQTSKPCEFVNAPDWNYNIEYSDDRIEGLPYQEDLFMPGFFETTLQPGESVIFVASEQKSHPKQFETLFLEEASQRKTRGSFQDDINYAAAQLIRKRKGRCYIVNTLPEMAEFPKEIFMSLPGLTLPDSNTSLFEKIVESLNKQLNNIVFGRLNGYRFRPDSPLWFIWAVQQYFFQQGDIKYVYKLYGNAINKIIKMGIENGISGLVTNSDYLLAKSLETENRFFVETNALWYNALLFAAEMNRSVGDEEVSEISERTAHNVKLAFAEMFVDSAVPYLPDSVSEDGAKDYVCRPSQILAAAMPYSIVDNDFAELILTEVERNLLTPKGLLTQPLRNNASAGSAIVVPEYTAFLAELYLKLRGGDSGLNKAKQLYEAFNEDNGLPSTPSFYQYYRSTPPYEGMGSPLCAVTVAAVNRIKMLIDQY